MLYFEEFCRIQNHESRETVCVYMCVLCTGRIKRRGKRRKNCEESLQHPRDPEVNEDSPKGFSQGEGGVNFCIYRNRGGLKKDKPGGGGKPKARYLHNAGEI